MHVLKVCPYIKGFNLDLFKKYTAIFNRGQNCKYLIDDTLKAVGNAISYVNVAKFPLYIKITQYMCI